MMAGSDSGRLGIGFGAFVEVVCVVEVDEDHSCFQVIFPIHPDAVIEVTDQVTDQVTALLEQAAPEEEFQAELNDEAKRLTDIGNAFHIRHTETNQTPLEEPEHVDYLFHRLFALIELILRRNE